MANDYDALLVVSFGGPEGPNDVLPFLENVLRGRNVPRERLLEVAEHYRHFGGISPLNEQNRRLIAALRRELADHDIRLPIYWGNRNWHPLLAETLAQMKADGVRRALAYFTSAYSSYSGCRQYRENIESAQSEVGGGAPSVEKLRVFFNHPGFIEPVSDLLRQALAALPDDRRDKTLVIFTAHSIPLGMSQNCAYVQQLDEAARLTAQAAGVAHWQVAYQSRSGPPTQPWLEPDILDALRNAATGFRDVAIVPIGFLSDHMEVLYDLDTEAAALAAELGLAMIRVSTVGNHPRFISMICELIQERLNDSRPRLALGAFGPSHDVCPVDCCLPPPRAGAR